MTALPTALSLSDSFTKVGAIAAFVALVGIAILALLFFSQARELKRLREWAGRAPERAAELEQRVTAGATARVQQVPPVPQVPPVRQVPRTTPVVARPAAASAVGAATRVVPTLPGEDTEAASKDAGQALEEAGQVTPKGPGEAGVIAPVTAAGTAVGAAAPPIAPGASAPDTGQTEVSPAGAPSTPAGSPGTAPSPTGETSPGTPGPRPTEADSPEGWNAVRAKTPSAQPTPSLSAQPTRSPETPSSSSSTSSPTPPIPAPAAPATAAAAARAQAGQAAATPRAPTPPRPPAPTGQQRRGVSGAAARATPAGEVERSIAESRARRGDPKGPSVGGGGSPARATLLIVGGVIVVVVVFVLILSSGGGGKSTGGGSAAGGQGAAKTASSTTGGARTHKHASSHHSESSTVAASPAATSVAVLNGTDTTGLAHTLSTTLRQGGYTQATALNGTPPGSHATTLVEYSSGHRAEAQGVASALSVTQVQPMEAAVSSLVGTATVVVIAGADKAAAVP